MTEPVAVLVTTTVGDEADARRIAQALLADRLAACVQVGPPVVSHYIWNGAREESREILCQAKTLPALVPAVLARIRSLHPYEVPELVVQPITEATPDYLAWMQDSVTGSATPPAAD